MKKSVYEYYDLIKGAKTNKDRNKYLTEAIALYPDDLDLLFLQIKDKEDSRKKGIEYIEALERIIEIGNKQMEDGGYFKNDMGSFWGVLETRPYMRMCFRYFTALLRNGYFKKAEKEGERLLKLCENDNLGARYHLMYLYAFLEEREKAEALFKLNTEDISTHHQLAQCFLYYKIGETEKARQILMRLKSFNKDLVEFVKFVLRVPIYFPILGRNMPTYMLNSYQELAVIYDTYNTFFTSCPLFFVWIKNELSRKKKKN